MSADMQDLIAKLQLSQSQQQQNQPNLFGLQAAPDPNATAQVLKKIQDQAYVSQQGNEGGEWGFINNAGKKDFARAGQGIAGMLGIGQPQQMDNSAVMQQRQAIQDGKGQLSDALAQPGADPLQARLDVLSKLAQAGVPGAADALAKAQDDQIKMQTSKAQAFKDTQQGNSAADEIQNRAQQRDMYQKRLDKSTAKDTWQTIATGNGYIVQKNGLGEIQTKKNQDAATANANAMTPQGMDAMLDSYHTTGAVPTGVAKAGLLGKFWDAEAAYQANTGNQAAATAANKAALKANTEALGQTQKQLSATTSYFDTMDKNIAQARTLANSINLTDVNALNRAYAAWEKGTSDPEFAKYNLFFDSVANEYAKIKSGSLGNAPVSDSARHEAMGVLLPTMSSQGVGAVFDAIKQEGQNRLDSLNSQRDDLVGRISGRRSGVPSTAPPQQGATQPPGMPPQGAPPAPAPPSLNYNPKTGKFE